MPMRQYEPINQLFTNKSTVGKKNKCYTDKQQ